MWEDDLQAIDLILIGKTGGGKSASGNSILQRNTFPTSPGGSSETSTVRCEWAEHSGCRIKVIDAPGLCDTKKANKKDTSGVSETEKEKEKDSDTEKEKKETDKEAAVRNMSKAIGMCNLGVHAFLLVINPFERDTEENKDTIKILKDIFSDDGVRNHCIIIVTFGESLDLELEESNLTFEEWCKQQDGERGKLFKECNYRCVLFYNKSPRYESERQQSVQNLLSLVKNMAATTGLYTHEQFEKMAAVREKMIFEEKAPEMSEEIQMKMSLLSADVNKCSKDSSEIHVGKLVERTEQIIDEIDGLAAKSEVFKKLQPQILSIKQNVDNMIQAIRDKKKGLLTEKDFRKKLQDETAAAQKKITATRRPNNSPTWKSYFRTCALTIAGVALVSATAVAGVAAAPALATTAVAGAALGAGVGGTGVIGGGIAAHALRPKDE